MVGCNEQKFSDTAPRHAETGNEVARYELESLPEKRQVDPTFAAVGLLIQLIRIIPKRLTGDTSGDIFSWLVKILGDKKLQDRFQV